MKYICILLIFIPPGLFGRTAIGQTLEKHSLSKPGHPVKLISGEDSLSYALGINYAQWLRSQGLEKLRVDKFDAAINTVLEGNTPVMNDQLVKKTITTQLQTIMQNNAAEAQKEGQQFLAANQHHSGVISLPSGLQYQVLIAGNGPRPVGTDRVTVDYEGKLTDGKVFDSSIQRGKPLTLGVNKVIKGWSEALQLMPVGSTWRLFIPPGLGYGNRQAGQIPPNSVLIFDVHLISIDK
ncbi:MAG TPA: FKBP-type peptidyl-prolyl cis-trans isomerase [Chitinophagaceae bacterium]|nr:FKBP-type peptidyl-prolyl cis-trans isomerase [Chitinophagaceae bacterium]